MCIIITKYISMLWLYHVKDFVYLQITCINVMKCNVFHVKYPGCLWTSKKWYALVCCFAELLFWLRKTYDSATHSAKCLSTTKLFSLLISKRSWSHISIAPCCNHFGRDSKWRQTPSKSNSRTTDSYSPSRLGGNISEYLLYFAMKSGGLRISCH